MEGNIVSEGEPPTRLLLGEASAVDGGSSAGDSAVTPLLLFTVFIAICGTFACGSAAGYSSPVESQIMEDLGLSTAQFSLFGSLLTVGALLGSLVSGRISDTIGRRGAMGLSDTFGLVGWILISISQETWSLDLGRFFIGVSLGMTVYLAPVYIAEITPKNVRGGLLSLLQLMQSCGIVVMFCVGSVIPWRILVLIGIIPLLVQLLGVIVIPESPRFLAKLGQSSAYKIVLQRLRGENIDVSQEAADIEEFTERLKQIPNVKFVDLFQRKYVHTLVAVCGLTALSGLGGPLGIIYYASSILESGGFSNSIGPILMAVVQIPSGVIGVYLIDKCGRRSLLMVRYEDENTCNSLFRDTNRSHFYLLSQISAGAMCFCCFLVGLMFLLQQNDYLENISPFIIVLGLWGYSGAYPFGMGAIPFAIMSEVFPMNVKGSAGSLAAVVNAAAVWVVSYTFNFVAEWSYSGAFFVLAGFNAFAVLFTAKFVPETKQRSLEEIQGSLSHVVHALLD